MKKYVIYCRKSTNDPSHQLYSLSAQEKLCTEYARRDNLTVIKIIKEKHSAKEAGKRPLFLEMLEHLKQKKYNGVIVHKVDRLLRSIGDYARIDDLRGQGIEFIFVDGSYPNNPDGNMMLGINVVFAKRYVENLSLEVKKGYQESISQGRFPRPAAIGYLDTGQGIKEIDPVYAPIVIEAFEMYATGDYSMDSLVEILRKKGLRTKRGQKYGNLISRSSLHRILTNTFYYGEMQYNGELYTGQHMPIISKKLFDKVQALLNSKSTSFRTRKPYAYRKLIRCHKCNGALSPYTKKNHTYYGCTSKNCSEGTIRENIIEEEISAIIKKFAFTELELKKARKALTNIEEKINSERNSKLKILENREKKLITELDRIRELLIRGTFTDEEYTKERNRINTALQETKIEKEAFMEVDQKRVDEIYDFLELSKNAPIYYKHGTLEEKRELIKTIFLEFKVESKKMAYYKLKPEFEILEKRHLIPNGESIGGTDGI